MTNTAAWYPANQEQDVRLALMLGYTHALVLDGYDMDTHARTPASWILPEHPFLVLGPLVVVRELVLDARGNTTLTGRGTRRRSRLKLRLHPRLSPWRWYKNRHKGWGGTQHNG